MSNAQFPAMIPLTGDHLEHIAQMYGIPRQEGESLDDLHQRVTNHIEIVKAGRAEAISEGDRIKLAMGRAVLLATLKEAGRTLAAVAEAQVDVQAQKRIKTQCGAIAEAHELLSPVKAGEVAN